MTNEKSATGTFRPIHKILVWDVPIRLFHWTFASSLTLALGIGWGADDDGRLFPFHMLFGLVAVFTLLIRVMLGLGGSVSVRFRSFPLRPSELARYLRGQFGGKRTDYIGHNPGSAWAAIAMFVLVPALVLTGLSARLEAVGALHEILALLLLAVIGAHLAGLIGYTLRHRENAGMAMLTGKRNGPPTDAIPSANGFHGLILLLAIVSWSTALFANYDSANGTVRLPVVNLTLRLAQPAHSQDAHDEDHEQHVKERHAHDD